MALPHDPIMLYSAVNMLLRDRYPDLTELCKGEDIDPSQLKNTLHDAGFDYDPDTNQFR